jgi:hypothetical protein
VISPGSNRSDLLNTYTNPIAMAWKNSCPSKARVVAGLPFRTAVIYVFLFAAAFWVYSSLWPNAPMRQPDSEGYLRFGQDLSNFHFDELQDRGPGYPLLLLITGSSRVPTRLLFYISLLLHFASIWLLASALYSLGLTEAMLAIFGLFLLLPPYVEYAAYVLSENLAEFMLVAGFTGFVFWYLHRERIWLVVSAVTIAYSGLTRPTYQVLALAMAGCLLVISGFFRLAHAQRRAMIKASVVLVCTSFVIIGGYAFRNYLNFNYFGIDPKLGLHLTSRTVWVIERLPDEYSAVREALIRARDAKLVNDDPSHTRYQYFWGVVPELTKITGLRGPQLSNYMLRINLLLIGKAPLHYLHEVVWGFVDYWFPSPTILSDMDLRSVRLLLAIIHFCLISIFALNLCMLIGAMTYKIMCKRVIIRKDKTLINQLRLSNLQGVVYTLSGTIVIYSAFISCLIVPGDQRLRVPTDGLIVFMSFLGVHLWWRLARLTKIVF